MEGSEAYRDADARLVASLILLISVADRGALQISLLAQATLDKHRRFADATMTWFLFTAFGCQTSDRNQLQRP